MKRELGALERSFVIADQHAPLHIVSVLQLENAPPPHLLKLALKVWQSRQPFLRVRLFKKDGHYSFESLVQPDIPLHILPRWNADHWTSVVEVELGTRIDVAAGPLFRCTYLYEARRQCGDIVFSFYHAIADAASASRFLHDLLTTCASVADQRSIPVAEFSAAPPVESRFPPGFRGLRLAAHSLRYMILQIIDELAYRRQTRGKQVPPVHDRPGQGRILTVRMSQDLLESFAQRARRERVTLNSALNAAILLAVNRQLYAGKRVPMRTLSFANLRPYLQPPARDEEIACYASMLRYTAPVEGGMDFWTLARALHAKIYSSFQSGDKFAATTVAEAIMKMATRLRSFRLSATALNYGGAVAIQPDYGDIRVTGFHSLVSAYGLGPQFSSQAQIFNHELYLDFMYLEADMNRQEAEMIVEEIERILSSGVSNQ